MSCDSGYDGLLAHAPGNYVIDRQTGRKLFESMPIYVRVGMHLLFVEGSEYMASKRVEKLLTDQSVKRGYACDG